MVEDSEPVWPEMQRETGDRSQDREMTDIGWEQEKLHWLSLLAPPLGQHLKMASLTDTEDYTSMTKVSLSWQLHITWPLFSLGEGYLGPSADCAAWHAGLRRGAGGGWPGQCRAQVSAGAQVRGRGRLGALTRALSCHSLLTSLCSGHSPCRGCTLVVTGLWSPCHTALPRCSELQLTALCPHWAQSPVACPGLGISRGSSVLSVSRRELTQHSVTGTTINTEAGPPLGLRTGSNFYPGHMGV